MANRDLIAVGGSTGATAVVGTMLSALPAGMPAAVFVVVHATPEGACHIAQNLQRKTALAVEVARDGIEFAPGHVYIAAADRHLLLDGSKMRLGRGPHENLARPAIDALFRSVAMIGSRAIGVLLTGRLRDGVAGLDAMKIGGAITVVQDPNGAAAGDMPRNALLRMAVDHCVAAQELGPLLDRLCRLPAGAPQIVPEGLALDVAIAGGIGLNGHNADTLNALGAALRLMEERAVMVRELAVEARSRNISAKSYDTRATEWHDHARTIRNLIGGSAEHE